MVRETDASVDDNVSYGDGTQRINTWVGVGTDSAVLAIVVDNAVTLETPRLDANARLIAAAPELYEALAELVETLRREAPGTALNNHRFDALGIKANNALSKARGDIR
jgi:hypothetical protein